MDDQPTAKPKSMFPISRIILLVVLLVAIVGLVFDQIARSKKTAAFVVVESLLGEEDAGTAPANPEGVHEKLGRQPDAPIAEVGGEMQETYTWQGALRRYGFHVRYTHTYGLDDGKRQEPILTSVVDIAGGESG